MQTWEDVVCKIEGKGRRSSHTRRREARIQQPSGHYNLRNSLEEEHKPRRRKDKVLIWEAYARLILLTLNHPGARSNTVKRIV